MIAQTKNDAPAASITISSSPGENGGNHAWLTVTAEGATHTYGTWDEGTGGGGPRGVRVDAELKAGYSPTGEGIVSRTATLNADQYAAFKSYLSGQMSKGGGAWSIVSTCAAFASNGWQAATGEGLKSRFMGVATPNQVAKSIVQANGGSSYAIMQRPNGNYSSTNSLMRPLAGSTLPSIYSSIRSSQRAPTPAPQDQLVPAN